VGQRVGFEWHDIVKTFESRWANGWACEIVGRPGLDLGTLGLKGTVRWLGGVAMVAHVV
jgi:hypothetical protein